MKKKVTLATIAIVALPIAFAIWWNTMMFIEGQIEVNPDFALLYPSYYPLFIFLETYIGTLLFLYLVFGISYLIYRIAKRTSKGTMRIKKKPILGLVVATILAILILVAIGSSTVTIPLEMHEIERYTLITENLQTFNGTEYRIYTMTEQIFTDGRILNHSVTSFYNTYDPSLPLNQPQKRTIFVVHFTLANNNTIYLYPYIYIDGKLLDSNTGGMYSGYYSSTQMMPAGSIGEVATQMPKIDSKIVVVGKCSYFSIWLESPWLQSLLYFPLTPLGLLLILCFAFGTLIYAITNRASKKKKKEVVPVPKPPEWL